MPRRGFIPKREVLADPIYNSQVVTKLINQVMLDGKRGVAQNAVYSAFDLIKEIKNDLIQRHIIIQLNTITFILHINEYAPFILT